MYPDLSAVISKLNINSVSENRKETLKPLVEFISNKQSNKEPIRLNFICTHNSRRSHLSQIWAQALAMHFKIDNVTCYSGGTEATAVYPRVIETLMKQGFKVFNLSESSNPVYTIKYDTNEAGVIAFSKKYDHEFNPESEFAAIMTCSQADAGCPFIAGAEKRIPITFEDPKAFDNTELEVAKYEERSLEIATDLFYVFSQINTNK
ncbi:arsenate-mycothiol transferase ArsC [Bizionia sp. KMM 8389]